MKAKTTLTTEELDALLGLFKKYKTLSARRVAELQKTYPATATRRIHALRKMGVPLKAVRVREGERGPKSLAWEYQP